MTDPVESREEYWNYCEFSFVLSGTRSDGRNLRGGRLFGSLLERERSGTSGEVEEDIDNVLILRRFVSGKRFALSATSRSTSAPFDSQVGASVFASPWFLLVSDN